MSIIKQAKQGVFWTFLQQFSVQIINFGVQILLARILMPSDFGLIAMIAIFIALGQNLSDGGMTTSLIRNKNNTELDYGTVFFANLLVSVGLYVITYFSAPLIALFYEQPVLTQLLRIYALVFVISSFHVVQVAKLTKELNFRSQFLYQLPSVIVGAIVGVLMAVSDYGVWSLVGLNLAQVTAFSFILWGFYSWRPKMLFNRKVFKYHFDFGYKLTISSILTTTYLNLYKIVIGKNFSVSTVGYFTHADNLRQFPVNQMSNILNKVTLPLFASIQDNVVQLRKGYQSVLRLVLTVSSVMMLILIMIANPLYVFVFGEKWLPAVPYFQILCIASVFLPINIYNLNILKVKGRTGLYLKVDVIKKIIGVVALLISIPIGIEAIVWSLCITNIFFAYFNGYFSGKLIDYTLFEQVLDTLKVIVLSLIPFGMLSYIQSLKIVDLVPLSEIIILPIFYIIIYLPIAYIFNKQLLTDIKLIIKR